MTPSEPAAPRLAEPPPLLVAVLVGAAQGAALWSLWSGPDGTGGSALDRLDPEVRAALVAALLIVPTSVPFLSAFVARARRLNFGVLVVAALAALLAAQSAVLAVLFAPVAVVLAHAAALSPGAAWWRPEYAAVWRSASSNLALLGGSAVFAGAFGAILALTAALFDAVGLTAVGRVLGDEVVALPLAAAAFSVGAVLLRRGRWLDGVASALATGLGWLAPVLLLVTVLFALSLPAAGFADLEGLFEGLLSSGLYLALVVGVVLLLSAAHADGIEGVVFPAPLRRFVRLALFALPLFASLALYGLSRRVAAYGLTEERVLGIALGSVLLIVSVGYAGWPRLRAARLERLGDVNLVGLALVCLVCLVLGVPGMRPIDLAARSQAARVANPDTPRRERALAVRHLAYEAGDTGRAELRRLSKLDLPP